MKNFIIDRKKALLCGAIVMMVLATAGITLAFLIDKTDYVENTFNPTEVTCIVDEDFTDKSEKKDVRIQNTGDTDAFIRADIIVTWQDGNGNIASVTPQLGEDKDYTMGLNLAADGWFEKNGYYYFSSKLVKDEFTDVLITNCKALKNGPDGYKLCVEIIADAVQADGVGTAETGASGEADRPAEIAWGVKVNTDVDGNAVSISAQ